MYTYDVVERNSRLCKVALEIPQIPGNFPGISGSSLNLSPLQELIRGLPQVGNWGPPLDLTPSLRWRVRSTAIQKGKTHVPMIFLPAPNSRVQRPHNQETPSCK